MAHNGKTISVGQLMWRVLKQPLLKDLTYEEASEYVLECIQLIGAPLTYCNKVTDPVLQLSNYKAEIPCDLIEIRGVRYLGIDGCETPIAMRDSTNLYHKSDIEQNSEIELRKEFVYTLEKGIIFTSREEGYIEIAYKGFMLDEDGFPLIPDNEQTKLAIEYYIMFRYLEQLWSMGKITDKVFQYYDQKKCWYMGAANTSLQMPSIDKMESIMNSLNRIIINDRAHETFYKNFGQKEYIKQHK